MTKNVKVGYCDATCCRAPERERPPPVRTGGASDGKARPGWENGPTLRRSGPSPAGPQGVLARGYARGAGPSRDDVRGPRLEVARSQRVASSVREHSLYRRLNYSDPFGLCVDKDVNCQNLVRMLREQKGSEFQTAADRFDSQKTGRVFFYSRGLSTAAIDGKNADGNPRTYVLGNTRGAGGDVFLRGDVSKGDLLTTAVHESVHLAGNPSEATASYAGYRAFNQLSPSLRAGAIFNADYFNQLWGRGYGAPLPGGVTESRQRQRYFVPSP